MKSKIILYVMLFWFLFIQGCTKVNLAASIGMPKEQDAANISQTVFQAKQQNEFRLKLSRLLRTFKTINGLDYISEKSKQFSSLLSDGWAEITKNLFKADEKRKNRDISIYHVKAVCDNISKVTKAVDEVNLAAKAVFSEKDIAKQLNLSDINTIEKVLTAGKRMKLHFIKQAEELERTNKKDALFVFSQIEKYNDSLEEMNTYANRLGTEWRAYN